MRPVSVAGYFGTTSIAGKRERAAATHGNTVFPGATSRRTHMKIIIITPAEPLPSRTVVDDDSQQGSSSSCPPSQPSPSEDQTAAGVAPRGTGEDDKGTRTKFPWKRPSDKLLEVIKPPNNPCWGGVKHPTSVLTAPLLFFHLHRFHGDTGPEWQNKAFYCWFCMKYSCKCTKY